MSMELDHSFTVPVPPDQAWNVLLDVEKIAPCMPGAQVDTVDGDDVAGRLKVKVGPVSLTYKGTATFKDRDTADRSVLVEASGKELRGAGTASATVRAALRPEDGSDSATLVTLHTTLNVTGRPAQFGRGVIAEVGSRLIDKFADNLAKELANGEPARPRRRHGQCSGRHGQCSGRHGSAGPVLRTARPVLRTARRVLRPRKLPRVRRPRLSAGLGLSASHGASAGHGRGVRARAGGGGGGRSGQRRRTLERPHVGVGGRGRACTCLLGGEPAAAPVASAPVASTLGAAPVPSAR